MLLLADHYLAAWRGASDSDETAEGPTDYDRACAINGFIGRIDVEDSQAIVLDDAPMHAVWWPLGRDKGVVVRIEYADSDDDIRRLLRDTDYATFERNEIEFVLPRGGLWLFEAAYGGEELPSTAKELPSTAMHIDLSPGRYEVSTKVVETKGVGGALHLLTRIAAP